MAREKGPIGSLLKWIMIVLFLLAGLYLFWVLFLEGDSSKFLDLFRNIFPDIGS